MCLYIYTYTLLIRSNPVTLYPHWLIKEDRELFQSALARRTPSRPLEDSRINGKIPAEHLDGEIELG